MSFRLSTARKLGILSILYFVQGLPYGFQLTALPVYLRSEGVSLTGIGLASALSLPWMIKVLWGPAVDRFGSRRFGRRRSWIVPMQLGLAASCAAAAFLSPGRALFPLLIAVLLMNLFAATMDVAVDGLAIDLLERSELGYGNVSQVVGYKLGMLTGGGLLVWASGTIGWRGIFVAMTLLVVLAVLATARFREAELRAPSSESERRARSSFRRVLLTLAEALRQPGAFWILAFIGTYKLGESMADLMFRPFLLDAGFSSQEIGLWIGTWGMVFSLAGSFLGGWLATRLSFLVAVGLTASLRAAAVAGEWWLALSGPTTAGVIAVTSAENLFGGALTTAMFAFMMSRVDRRIGATHYTLLATVEVAGKLSAFWVSGVLADHFGYARLFGLAAALALAYLLLLLPLRRAASGAEGRPAGGGDPSPEPGLGGTR